MCPKELTVVPNKITIMVAYTRGTEHEKKEHNKPHKIPCRRE